MHKKFSIDSNNKFVILPFKNCTGRWFTSWFIHHSFEHITSNMALFVVVAYQIEEKYGTWRITILYFMSALGGGLVLLTNENYLEMAHESGFFSLHGTS